MTRLDLEVLQTTSGFGGADIALSLAVGAILDRAETTAGDVTEGLLVACRVIDALRGELREAAKAPRPVLVDEHGECPDCDGRGEYPELLSQYERSADVRMHKCVACGGTGHRVDEYRLDADGQMTPGILAELEVGR